MLCGRRDDRRRHQHYHHRARGTAGGCRLECVEMTDYTPRPERPIRDRLESVSIPVPMCGCLVWLGSLDTMGYGHLRVGGLLRKAHRVSWSDYHKQPVPKGMHVLHSCDVRSCIEPTHLRLGTHQENMSDKVRRGRQSKGITSGRNSLDDDKVRRIRGEGRSAKYWAELFGVSDRTVQQVVAGKSWRHVQ